MDTISTVWAVPCHCCLIAFCLVIGTDKVLPIDHLQHGEQDKLISHWHITSVGSWLITSNSLWFGMQYFGPHFSQYWMWTRWC